MTAFDTPVISGLVVLYTLLFLVNIRSLLKILPALGDCLNRWKGNLDLEDSLQLSRSRNLIAGILFVPSCLIVYRYGLFEPRFLEQVPEIWRFPAVLGIFLLYLLVRGYLNWQLEMHDYGRTVFTAANRSFFSYLIALFLLLFLIGGILPVFVRTPETRRTVLLVVLAAFYLFYLLRRSQIFASVCNPFITILYLCGLEILPTGLLVFTAVLL